ncbi:hypothetical protein SAMN02745218_01214 [Desulfofundulus australicus DSM 11792]|uniref:Uncharacterized protein n=1 Tax=Desulfofundulus australicus DSM 11792 TaxID=1121425 RepID=A0A1M4XYD2_9FIRM|nr:hypothetical protein SAMN02745218_01214 [Desulfofundulus australicus DSM 11792]
MLFTIVLIVINFLLFCSFLMYMHVRFFQYDRRLLVSARKSVVLFTVADLLLLAGSVFGLVSRC